MTVIMVCVCCDCNAIGVQHKEVPNLLTVTLMMVLVLVYGSYIQVPNLGARW